MNEFQHLLSPHPARRRHQVGYRPLQFFKFAFGPARFVVRHYRLLSIIAAFGGFETHQLLRAAPTNTAAVAWIGSAAENTQAEAAVRFEFLERDAAHIRAPILRTCALT